jgi:hypothetical protein
LDIDKETATGIKGSKAVFADESMDTPNLRFTDAFHRRKDLVPSLLLGIRNLPLEVSRMYA